MIQTIYDYLVQFLQEKNIQTVVEIGSDRQLELALKMAPYCNLIYSVNLLNDNVLLQKRYQSCQTQAITGIEKITLISGNAVQLSSLIPSAELIVLQDVLIDGTGGVDTQTRYNGETELSDTRWAYMMERFKEAEISAYRGFLQVAKPGYIVRFTPRWDDIPFKNMLINQLGVERTRIQTKEVLHNYTREEWLALFIDNS